MGNLKSSLASFHSLTSNYPLLISYLGNFLFEKICLWPHPLFKSAENSDSWMLGMGNAKAYAFLIWVKPVFVVHALLTYYPNIWTFGPSRDLT